MPMFRRFNKDFFKVWSNEMAYVLGYTFADGAVYTNSRGSCYLEFTSVDRELIYKVRSLLASEHKVSLKKRNAENPNWKDSYRLQIGGKELLKDLEKFGIRQNKSLVIRFPTIPKKYLGDFVRGYFDGDGSANLGKYWRKDRNKLKWQFSTMFTSGSRDFLVDLKKKLNTVTCGGFIHAKNRGFDLVYSVKDSLALFNFMYHNASTEMFLKRKYSIFQKAFKSLNLRA